MPCPSSASYSGSDSASVSFKPSSAAASAAAQALVPQAARGSAIHQALKAGLCPADCPYPYASNVRYTITRVVPSFQWFFNVVLFGWFHWLTDGSWWWEATAYYNWSATVSCSPERLWLAAADDVVVKPEPVG
jgi:hypothetical protein